MEHILDHPQKCIGVPKFTLSPFARFLIALGRRLYLLRISVIFMIPIRHFHDTYPHNVNSFLYPYRTDVLARANVWAFPVENFRTCDHLSRPVRLISCFLHTFRRICYISTR